jgi:chromosome segregation protein
MHAARRAQEATAALSTVEAAFREAEARRHRLEARAEALGRAAAEAGGSAGAEALSGGKGVRGVLGELVEVDEGWERGLEAALGPAASGVVVDDTDAARTAVSRLRSEGVRGTVVPLSLAMWAGGPSPGGSGPGLRPLRPMVRPRQLGGGSADALQRVLDRLLAGVVVAEDWREAADLALDHPQLVVVTRAGDRLSPSGWVVGAGGARAATAAAEEARAQSEDAADAAGTAAAQLEQARRAWEEATTAEAEASLHAERTAERHRAAAEARARVTGELVTIEEETADTCRQRDVVSGRVDDDTAEIAGLEARLAELEEAADSAGQRLGEAEVSQRLLGERRELLEATARHVEVRVAALTERRAVLSTRLADVERRLAGHVAEREAAGDRRRRIEEDIAVVDRLGSVLQRAALRIGEQAQRLQQARARQVDEARAGGERLEALRRRRSEAERALGELRERLQAVELETAEAAVRHEAAAEALRRELGCDPSEAQSAPCPELPEGTTAEARAAAVERELAALGPVNPLAMEELGGLEERHRFLEEQTDDVRRARRELQQLIREVDDEIMRVFTEAFADVNAHFQVLVSTLFPGGAGRLSLSEPEDLLNTGVEVEARPAGKNVRKLSLLSGGERSLVALAFLFAVFRSRPSPFYLLDEVEAALDDVNLHRFLDLLHEFREEAQLIVVSHQKRTMESADALYGVTMTPGGSSKVVSQKVRRAAPEEATAAAG